MEFSNSHFFIKVHLVQIEVYRRPFLYEKMFRGVILIQIPILELVLPKGVKSFTSPAFVKLIRPRQSNEKGQTAGKCLL